MAAEVLILASASPRRRQILTDLGIAFEAIPADLDEEALTLSDPFETARTLARAKALSVLEARPSRFVLGSDTVVAFRTPEGWRQLAKPVDSDDACRMLRTLSGRTHTVATGVALVGPDTDHSFVETADVTFRELSDAEISAYVATGEPMDKAGSYGLQGFAADFVLGIAGDPTTVIGLPKDAVKALLEAHGIGAG
ncbi:septum formation protein Maf [bacterium]|nr:MAG: septum formation protein Maf [bacterium]